MHCLANGSTCGRYVVRSICLVMDIGDGCLAGSDIHRASLAPHKRRQEHKESRCSDTLRSPPGTRAATP